jgi:beta-lactamase regulating signal transducer with metallopeptidase domain
LNWLWQGATVAAALFVILRWLRRARANLRYVVCGLTLLIVLAMPAFQWTPLGFDTSQLATLPTSRIVAIPAQTWTSITVQALWCLWAVAQTLRVSRAAVALRRARHTARPFPADVERQLRHWRQLRGTGRQTRLVLSETVGSAAVLGGGKPLIAVAPVLLERLSAAELDCVVLHEWAHVQRRDDLAVLLQLAGRIIAGWHPAVRWIDDRLRMEREVACDEIAVDFAGSAKSYASCLLTVADLSRPTTLSIATPGVLTGSGLRYRLTRIVCRSPRASRLGSMSLASASLVALLALSVAVAGFELFATAAPQAPAQVAAISTRAEPTTWPTSDDDRSSPPAAAPPRTSSPARQPAVIRTSVPPAATDPASEETADGSLARESPTEPDPPSSPVPSADETALNDPLANAEAVPAATFPAIASAPPVDPPPLWTTAADAGTALGRRSKAAGVATGAFFTRFARRVAGSF